MSPVILEGGQKPKKNQESVTLPSAIITIRVNGWGAWLSDDVYFPFTLLDAFPHAVAL